MTAHSQPITRPADEFLDHLGRLRANLASVIRGKEEGMVLPIIDRRVRVGVLGAGRWAQMAHLPGWARDPRTELVAICDIDPDRLSVCSTRGSASKQRPGFA